MHMIITSQAWLSSQDTSQCHKLLTRAHVVSQIITNKCLCFSKPVICVQICFAVISKKR